MTDEATAPAAGATSAPSPSPSPAPAPSAPAAAAPAAASPSTSPAAPTKVERPAYVPAEFWDTQANKVKETEFGQRLNDLTAFKAAEDSRKLALPQKPEDYKVALPKDFKGPEGIEFKFDETSPTIVEARKVAHELGIGQDGFGKFLALYAGAQLQSMTEMKAARDAEITKLGAAGPARVDAVNTWIKATLGDDGFKALEPMMVTAGIVQQFERLMQKVVSQGGASFSTAHREQQNGKVTDEAYNAMTPAQRLDYARSHSNGSRTN